MTRTLRTATVAVLLVGGVGCGDNLPAEGRPDARVPGDGAGSGDGPPEALCTPNPTLSGPGGTLGDPAQIPLPTNCVNGGVEQLAGRWFVRYPDGIFNFEYPRFEGTCPEGFRRTGLVEEAAAEGYQRVDSWNDGAHVYYRKYYIDDDGNGNSFEAIEGVGACLLPDGTMAMTQVFFQTGNGTFSQSAVGTRLEPAGAPASGITLDGELGTRPDSSKISAYNLVLDGTTAFVCGPGGLDIVDVSNPAAPAYISHVDGDFNDVKLVRGNGHLVAYGSPLSSDRTAVIDVTDPANPDRLADLPEYSHSIFVEEHGGITRLYLATAGGDRIPIYDVTNPIVPLRLGAVRIPGNQQGGLVGVHDLFVDGDILYPNYGTAGFFAIDISAGIGSPVVRGSAPASGYSHASWGTTIGGRAIMLHGDEGFSTTFDGAAYMRVLAGDPNASDFLDDIGEYRTRREVGIHNIITVGDKAYIAYYHDGVRVVSLADPTAPVEVAHYNTWDFTNGWGGTFEGAVGIRVANGHIYVADYNRGLLILTEQ